MPFSSATDLDRAVLGHKDRLARRGRRLVADVDQRGARGLGEDRRGFAGGAEIDRADIERFEELRSGRELGPGHGIAERLQLGFEQTLLLEQHERAVFLIADADGLVFGVGG